MNDPDLDSECRPTFAELVPVLIPLLALGVTLTLVIVVTKALIAAYPSVEAGFLLLIGGGPIIAVFYIWAKWWGNRNA